MHCYNKNCTNTITADSPFGAFCCEKCQDAYWEDNPLKRTPTTVIMDRLKRVAEEARIRLEMKKMGYVDCEE